MLHKKISKKWKKIQLKSKRSRIDEQFNPVLTFHALQRIWQRLQEDREKESFIQWCWFSISWPIKTHWIHPDLVRAVLIDIKHYLTVSPIYSEKHKRFVIRWKLAYYAIAPDHSVITIMSEFFQENYKIDEYKIASIDFIMSYLRIQ